jgi:AbrB family looped-hinge helix DNA binding protein
MLTTSSFKKIQRVTSKGQITLPVSWRKEFKTDQVMVAANGRKIEISPVNICSPDTAIAEYTVFDAIRDNKGRGIKAKDLLKILKKIE